MTDQDNYKKRVEEEVLKTLSSMDDLPEIEPGPYFYAHVQQRLNESKQPAENWLGRLLFGRKLAPAFLAAIVLVNTMTVYFALQEEDISADSRDEQISAIAELYSLGSGSPLSEIGQE